MGGQGVRGRFGATGGFFVAGFLVSIEVFANLRVPFTSIVIWRRHAQEPSGYR